MLDLSLPPSVTVSPTVVGVSVVTNDGITVQISLPRPRGLHDLPAEVVADRAMTLARAALKAASDTLEAA